jgi:hypothetical protein
MRSLRLLSAAASLTLVCAAIIPAQGQDSMGGFDRAYTNRSNNFGHGLWGDGRGTALPVPDRGTDFGFYYGQPYDGGATLFGTGFWTAEYMARRAEGGDRGRRGERIGDDDFRGPMGDKVAYSDNGKGDGWDDKGGKPPKDGHGKPEKPPHKPPPHKPPHEHKPPKELVRYVPYGRTQYVMVPRRTAEIVIIQEQKTFELGEVRVTERQRRREAFSAICLDGKGNEHPAILSSGKSDGDEFAGEIFRCEGDQMLRVSYATGAVAIAGSVRTGDGTSYKDCDGGDALVRTADGELACAVKRPMSRKAERALARNSAGYEAEIAYEDDHGVDYAAGGDAVDLTGLELTGGVGN